jgi:hypothetical protein
MYSRQSRRAFVVKRLGKLVPGLYAHSPDQSDKPRPLHLQWWRDEVEDSLTEKCENCTTRELPALPSESPSPISTSGRHEGHDSTHLALQQAVNKHKRFLPFCSSYAVETCSQIYANASTREQTYLQSSFNWPCIVNLPRLHSSRCLSSDCRCIWLPGFLLDPRFGRGTDTLTPMSCWS